MAGCGRRDVALGVQAPEAWSPRLRVSCRESSITTAERKGGVPPHLGLRYRGAVSMTACVSAGCSARETAVEAPIHAEILLKTADDVAWSQKSGFATATSLSRKRTRVNRLRTLRLVFGFASLLWLGAVATCLATNVSYEPAAAMACCFTGIFAVFAMKVRDAAR